MHNYRKYKRQASHSDFKDRTMFYWAKLFTSELESGQNYLMLMPAITINILDFVMFPTRKDYHTEVVPVIRDTGEVYSDKFHIHIFELKKLHKNFDKRNRREMWLNFINSSSEEDYDMLKQLNDPIMNKAMRVIIDMSADTQIREIARIREKALHDEAFYIEGARTEGIEIGMEKGKEIGINEGIGIGIEKERAKIIAKLKARGMTDEEIEAFYKD